MASSIDDKRAFNTNPRPKSNQSFACHAHINESITGAPYTHSCTVTDHRMALRYVLYFTVLCRSENKVP